MKYLGWLFLMIPFMGFGQEKQVVSTYPNGNPELIIYVDMDVEPPQIVKEEAYFESGKMQYTGTYKNGKEDGVWVYYYESGVEKFREEYREGVEHGIRYEYAPDGSIDLEIHYENGRKLKQINHKE